MPRAARLQTTEMPPSSSPGSETRQPFVEQQNARPRRKRTRQFDALLLDIGQLIEPPISLEQQIELAEETGCDIARLLERHSFAGAVKHARHDGLDRRKVGRHAHELEGSVDAPANTQMIGQARHILAVHADRAGVRPDGAGDEVQKRGLARAVGTDQSQHLARGHRQRDAVDGDEAAERLAQTLRLQQRGQRQRLPFVRGAILTQRSSIAPAMPRGRMIGRDSHAHASTRGPVSPRASSSGRPSAVQPSSMRPVTPRGRKYDDHHEDDPEQDAEPERKFRLQKLRQTISGMTPSTGPHSRCKPPRNAMMTTWNETRGLKAKFGLMKP